VIDTRTDSATRKSRQTHTHTHKQTTKKRHNTTRIETTTSRRASTVLQYSRHDNNVNEHRPLLERRPQLAPPSARAIFRRLPTVASSDSSNDEPTRFFHLRTNSHDSNIERSKEQTTLNKDPAEPQQPTSSIYERTSERARAQQRSTTSNNDGITTDMDRSITND